MSEAGAKVLNAQAVQFAKEAKIILHARSTFNPGNETIIKESFVNNSPDVLAVVYESEIIRIFLHDSEKIAWTINFMDENQIPVKEFHYSGLAGDRGHRSSFIISTNSIYNWEKIRQTLEEQLRDGIYINESLGALSLIGEGFSQNNKVLTDTIKLLGENGIQFFGITTTSFRISILVERELLNEAVKICHQFWISPD